MVVKPINGNAQFSENSKTVTILVLVLIFFDNWKEIKPKITKKAENSNCEISLRSSESENTLPRLFQETCSFKFSKQQGKCKSLPQSEKCMSLQYTVVENHLLGVHIFLSPSPKVFNEYELAFPTGQDSPTFWDKGTEIPCPSTQ